MENGKEERGEQILEEVLEVTNSIFKESSKSFALIEISKVLIENGKEERGEQIFEEALEVANSISNDYLRSMALIEISKVLMENGKVEKSLDVTNSISDDSEKSKALLSISKVLIETGKVEKSLEVANSISDDRTKSRALLEISKVLIKQNRASYIHTFLAQNPASSVFYQSFIPSYQLELDVPYIRKSSLFSPFSYQITEGTVMNLIRKHYKDGKDDYAHAIIRQCPQLGLDYLLPVESERPAYTYATWKSWIDSVEDEDDQDDIRSWARRVKKGKMTEDDFEERVRDVLL